MNTITMQNRKAEAGFTLVELAIVMIIIGLLIGGVLKGQELANNAKITATVAQVKAIDAAASTFKDMYNSMPGDIRNASARLPNCNAAPCSVAGANGNGRVEGAVNFATPTGEATAFFVQLAAADLLSGIDGTAGTGWGQQYPKSKSNGGFYAGYNNNAVGTATAANARAGNYLYLISDMAAGAADDTLTPNEAFRIDSKLDDGVGDTGTVIARAAQCAAAGVYQEAQQGRLCDLAIRIQN